MDSERKVNQVFNSNPQGSWLRGRPIKQIQTGINKCKVKNWKERSNNRAYWGGEGLDCSAN
jgi:hypothetical protein